MSPTVQGVNDCHHVFRNLFLPSGYKDRLELTKVTTEICVRQLCPLAFQSNKPSQMLAAESKNQ